MKAAANRASIYSIPHNQDMKVNPLIIQYSAGPKSYGMLPCLTALLGPRIKLP